MEFSKDGSILVKSYSDNCIVKKLDQRLIIMITYDKNIFSANDRY